MILNILLLTGTIIGAGMFSLPFVFQKLNWTFPWLLFFLTLVSIYLSYIYIKIIKNTQTKHQLPGYIKIILGKNWGRITSFLLLFSTGGALLAYLILGGKLLGNVFLFYLLVSLPYLLKPKVLEKWSDVLTTVLVIGLIFLIIKNNQNIKTNLFYPNLTSFVEGYGVILFSLTGFSIIPELKLKNKTIYQSIIFSYTLIFFLYLLFSIFVSPLKSIFFYLIGLLAIISSYLPLSIVFEDILTKDIQFSPIISKITTLTLPIILYFIGLDNFLSIISLTGGIFIGSLAILILLAYIKIKKRRSFIENILLITSLATFLGGIIGKIIS